MTNKELLKLAAKAAGYELDEDGDRLDERENPGTPKRWNPLTDDGDALRLAVRTGIIVDTLDNEDARTIAWTTRDRGDVQCYEPHGSDPYAATRRAIVRAAAELGKS